MIGISIGKHGGGRLRLRRSDKMKKRQLTTAICALLGSAFLLSSCSGGSSTSFSSNWCANTAINTVVEGTSETLTYDVALDPDSAGNDAYSVHYSNGTYTTSLSAEQKNGELLYRYHTELNISVQYLFDGQYSEIKADKVITTVYFMSTKVGLQPVSSSKEVESRSPAVLTPTSLETCYTDYHFTVETEYQDNCTKGTCVYTDLTKEEAAETSSDFSIGDDYSYIDNEQLLFAVRCMSLSSSQQIQSYNASINGVQTVRISASDSESDEFEFAINGTNSKRAIEYYPASVVISASNPGATQTAWIAKTTSATNNVNRNVMLRLQTPISYNLGTLVYTLKSANFTAA